MREENEASRGAGAMSKWKICRLAELVDGGHAELQTGPFGTMLNASEYTASGTPVIAVQDIGENKIIHDKLVYVSDTTANRLSKYRVKEGDIIFGRKGAVERRARIRTDEDGWLQGSDCIRLRFNETVNPIFISYQFGSKFYREWMIQNSTGATMPSLNQEVLRLLPIMLPPFHEQKAIASVLSSLDDKIDLLHRQNATLEAMAEALFRQRFVVEAKEEWEEKPLLHHIQLVGGGTPKTSIQEYWNGSIPWLAGGDIAKNHKTFALASEKSITEEGVAYSSAKILPQYTTVLTARGTVGKFCLLGKPMAYSQTNYGILPKNSETFFFTFLLIDHIVKELQAAAYGSVFDTITTQTFEETSIALPKADMIKSFNLQVRAYFEKIFANQTQIRTLEKLRDSLLPKLMTGEVRVS